MWARMAIVRKNPLLGYGVALIATSIALGVRFALGPYLRAHGLPFLTFFPAVMASALVGGLGPSLLASAMSAFEALYFFLPYTQASGFETRTDAIAFVFFVTVLLFNCVAIHVMHTALDRAREQRETNAELARELEARLSELRLANEQLETASHSKSRLMASVGHDLRQPLNVISLALHALEQGVREPAEQALLARTGRNVASLARSFDQLLESARLDARGFQPQPAPMPVAPLLAQLTDEFTALAGEKRLQLDIAPSTAHVVSDPSMLLSILRNLVGNAVKYTPSGGTIRVCTSQRSARQTRLEVIDSGPGIPPDKLDVIFREFERLTPGEGDGIGLGLSLVKRNAELLGHPLVVASTPGEGSCFGLDVPTAPPPSPPVAAAGRGV